MIERRTYDTNAQYVMVILKLKYRTLSMRHQNNLIGIIVMLATFISGQAVADICLTVDETRDSLTPAERTAALALLSTAFTKVGETVVDAPCDQTYTLTNIRLGESITSTVSGPKGTRMLQVEKIEELGGALDQIANSLITGATLADNSGTAVNRQNVTTQQAVPNRVENDALVYALVGPGYVVGADSTEIPINFGFGYRYELDSVALDIALQRIISADRDTFIDGTFISIGVLYFMEPVANHSSFWGGGFGFSGMEVNGDSGTRDTRTGEMDTGYRGEGLHLRLSAGYEFFRATTMRLFVQADTNLPMYEFHSGGIWDDDSQSYTNEKTKYAPSLGLSIGGGWSKEKRNLTVRHL